MIRRGLVALCLTVGCLLIPAVARAHELESASLSLTEVAAGRFLVRFHVSSSTLQEELAAPARFPAPCELDAAYLECGPAGLVGTIEFPWLEGTLTRVMVEIQWQNGTRLLRVVSPSSPALKVYGIPAAARLRFLKPIIFDYTSLGIEHILTGFDHVLFVIALGLLVRGGARLLTTITAFTLAHSLSLALTVLGLVQVPGPPVEATIALSIVFVCAECARAHGAGTAASANGGSLTQRAPWIMAFAFGLLHGLGFASALLAIGLPEQHVPIALACFNVGVELGQLAVIAAVGVVRLLLEQLRWQRPWLSRALIYTMGGVAACWSLDRVAAVFGR